ncbi:uncharacterized protein LOC125674073 [Ostrea edulis]|uniref:uncharacterized protein LOC125674073 n=1 Tax=Ostrea edulis TaxID=37623 RepID=UPI0024AFCD2A|nr:uncharacterized protein LOC125674073 [Ostrea edulis]
MLKSIQADINLQRKDTIRRISAIQRAIQELINCLLVTEINHQNSSKRTIHYVLKEYPAVKEALKNSHIECEKAYNYYRYYDGQEETCPTELQLVTKVYIGEEWCDVAKPDYQCVTAASCQTPKEPCAGYQKWPRTSSCMYAGFRYFRVWVFCRSCGFKLIKLKSPQCCSCWTFQMCEGDGGGR